MGSQSMTWKAAVAALLLAGVAVSLSAGSAAAARQSNSRVDQLDQLLNATFTAAYNLDHADAIRLARSAVALAPDNPRPHRVLATVLWLELLFRQGALTLDYQLSGLARTARARAATPADLDAEIRRELARATALSEASVRRTPANIEAQYEYGAIRALEASYAATVEGSTTSAFGAARHAYDAHERVLDSNPAHASATVTVGSYRYLISGLALPGRMIAYLAGFGGGKEKGIAMLEAARRDPIAQIDAATALLLIYSREGRHVDALAAAWELQRRFPRNRLFLLEAGAAAVRAGRMEDADASLTRGLTVFAADPRPKMPGELALLRYKRGLARLSRSRVDEAATDLNAALDAAPAGWIEGRVRLELGRIASIRGANQQAAAEYGRAEQACQAVEDRSCASEAARRIQASRNSVK